MLAVYYANREAANEAAMNHAAACRADWVVRRTEAVMSAGFVQPCDRPLLPEGTVQVTVIVVESRGEFSRAGERWGGNASSTRGFAFVE